MWLSSGSSAQIIGARPHLSSAAGLLDRAFGTHATLQLVFVMLVCPLGMNLLQARPSPCARGAHGQHRNEA